MDHLMAEKLTKIIKTAKWGKSHQKNIKKKNQNEHELLHRIESINVYTNLQYYL